MLFDIVYIAHLTTFAITSPFCLLPSEKFKTEKHPWTEEKKQTSPKKKERTHFCVGKNTETPL